jgi:hypothetical protein
MVEIMATDFESWDVTPMGPRINAAMTKPWCG